MVEPHLYHVNGPLLEIGYLIHVRVSFRALLQKNKKKCFENFLLCNFFLQEASTFSKLHKITGISALVNKKLLIF